MVANLRLRFQERAIRTVEIIASACILLLLVHTIANVVTRYFFNSPIPGTNEYGGYWHLPLIAFLGFVCAKTRGQHVEARLIYDRLKPQNQREYQVFSSAITALVCLVFAYYGFAEAVHSMEIGLTGGVTSVIIWPVTFLVPISFAILALQYFVTATVVARDDHFSDRAESVEAHPETAI